VNRRSDQDFSLPIHQAQSGPAGPARPRYTSHNPDLSRPSPAPVLDASDSSLLPPPSADDDAVAVSQIFEYDTFGLTLPNPGHQLSRPARLRQSPRIMQREIIRSTEAQHAALAMSYVDALTVNGPQHPRNAAGGPRFVRYGEADPERQPKRRDRVEDKHRKAKISMWHGTCFNCKKAKKQCIGKEVCDRCQKSSLACIRTCDSCWANKKLVCDDEARCKNCQRSRKECCRPSATGVTLADVRPADDLPPSSPSHQLEHVKSSAHVNNHNLWETESAIDAPTAWNVGFEVPIGPRPSGKRHRSLSLEKDLLRPPQQGRWATAGQRSDESAMEVNSDAALGGSQRYSQQVTDVDLPQTFTKGSTIIASDQDALSAPNKREIDLESCSQVTEHSFFDEAIYGTNQISPHLKGNSSHLQWDMQEHEVWSPPMD
jgi:hypothetical protein